MGHGPIENLKPYKKGDVGNPKGINGYTYRADAERSLAKWCKEHGDQVIERLVADAVKGRGYAMKLMLERILPAVQKHEVDIPGADESALDDFLVRFAAKKRTNGDARGNGSTDETGLERGDA